MAAPSAPPLVDLGAVVRAVQGVRGALAATPLSSALEPPVRDLVTLFETQTVGDALQTLAAWNLLSAPVVKGAPPWLRARAEAQTKARQEEIASKMHVLEDVGAANPRMADLLGFISVNAIMRAFVAETTDIRADSAAEVAAAASELWGMQIMEAFDADALALDWEVVGATSRDETATWAVRGVPSAQRSLLDIIHEGFLAPSRAARFTRTGAAGAPPSGAPGGAGAHRVGVWSHVEARGGDAVLVNVFSQSDAVRFLVRAEGVLGEEKAPADVAALLDTPLAALGLGATAESADGGGVVTRPVATIAADAPVLSALRAMVDAGVSALAVVDGDGALVANFSASDVRCLMPAHLSALALPVAAFLEGLGRMSYYTYSGLAAKDINRDALVKKYRGYEHFRMLRGRTPRAPARPLAAVEDTVEGWAATGVHPVGVLDKTERRTNVAALRPDAPLREALRRMTRAGLHRIYTVDEADKPVGVVTLTDVLRLVGSDTTLDWLTSAAADPAAAKASFHWRRAAHEAGAPRAPPPLPREA